MITIGAGGGTVTSPIVPPTETALSYTAGAGSCASGLSGAPSLKDVIIWYASGNLYTGDDNGRIYKITNAFTAPAVAYCISTGSNAVTDVNVDENVTWPARWHELCQHSDTRQHPQILLCELWCHCVYESLVPSFLPLTMASLTSPCQMETSTSST